MRHIAALVLGLVIAPMAHGEVKASAPDGLIIERRGEAAMTKEALWSRLVRPALWWSGEHTYSQSAANLALQPAAGGCWCETWKGGAVEHGRVIAIMPNQLLRLDTALGPLQELGVKGALTFEIADAKAPGRVVVVMTYRVVGSSASKLDALAAAVDGVLGQQFERLLAPAPPVGSQNAAPKGAAPAASH